MNSEKTSILRQIVDGAARAFFASAWTEQCEEAGQEQMLSGREIMTLIPAVIDPAAICATRTMLIDVANANGKSINDLYTFAQSLPPDGADRELTPELFGHYLAMQAIGTGVGLESFGYAVGEAIRVPYCEFGGYALAGDYFKSEQ